MEKYQKLKSNLEEANQLKINGKFEDAIIEYQKISEEALNDINAISEIYISSLINLGTTYESIENFDMALKCFEKISKHKPNSPHGYARMSHILFQIEKLDEALITYKKALEIEPNLPGWVYKLYGDALLKNNQIKESINAYKLAISLDPNVYHWNISLGEALFKDNQIEELNKLYEMILSLDKNSSSIFYEKLLKYIYLNDIWHELNQKNINVDSLSLTNLKSLKEEEVRQYFMKVSSYKVIYLSKLNSEDRNFLKNSGLSLNFLNLNSDVITKDYKYSDDLSLDDKTKNIVHLPLDFDKNLQHRIQRTSCQTQMIEDGCVYAICPNTGVILESRDSILSSLYCDRRIFYRFVGNEVFYLIIHEYFGERNAIYFPNRELIVYFHNVVSCVPFNIGISCLKAYIVCNSQEVYSYLTNQKERTTVALVGGATHPGHHLWNDLSGLQYVCQSGKYSHIKKILVITPEYFGKIEEIFPEIDCEKVIRLNKYEASKKILEENYFAVKLGHLIIEEKLTEKVFNACINNSSPEILVTIDKAKEEHFPLLWITIRLHNRSWKSQLEGTTNVINALAQDFPDIGIVFDGYSRLPDHYELASNLKEEQNIKEEKEFVSLIESLVLPRIKIYNTLGCLMSESIAWAYAIDVYLIPWGGGGVKVCLLANKPGLIHTTKEAYKTPIWARWLSWERENVVVPKYVPEEHIIDIPEKLKQHGNIPNNYDCNWEIVYDELVKLIRELKFRKYVDKTIL